MTVLSRQARSDVAHASVSLVRVCLVLALIFRDSIEGSLKQNNKTFK